MDFESVFRSYRDSYFVVAGVIQTNNIKSLLKLIIHRTALSEPCSCVTVNLLTVKPNLYNYISGNVSVKSSKSCVLI